MFGSTRDSARRRGDEPEVGVGSAAPFKARPSADAAWFELLPPSFISPRPNRVQVGPHWGSGACAQCTPESKLTFPDGLSGLKPVARLTRVPSAPVPFPTPTVEDILTHPVTRDSLPPMASSGTPAAEALQRINVTQPANTDGLARRWAAVAAQYPGGILYSPGQLDWLQSSMQIGHPTVYLIRGQPEGWESVLVNAALVAHDLPPARPVLDAPHADCPEALVLLPDVIDDADFTLEMAVFRTYLTRDGHHLILRVLDERERLLNRKYELWEHLIEMVEEAVVDDVHLVPVSVAREPGGPGSRLKIEFTQPISLQELMAGGAKLCPGLLTDRVGRVRFMTDHFLSILLQNEAVQPLELLSAVQQLDPGYEVNGSGLPAQLFSMIDQIHSKKKDLAFSGIAEDVMERLEHQIQTLHFDRGALPIEMSLNVTRLLAGESILANLVLALQPSSLTLNQWVGVSQDECVGVSRSKLAIGSKFLWKLVPPRYRCVPPCQDLDMFFQDAIDWLIMYDVLRSPRQHDGSHARDQWSRRMARNIDLADTDDGHGTFVQDKMIHFVPQEKPVRIIQNYSNILRPHFLRVSSVLKAFLRRLDPDEEGASLDYDNHFANVMSNDEFLDVGICLERLDIAGLSKDGALMLSEDWQKKPKLLEYLSFLEYFLRR